MTYDATNIAKGHLNHSDDLKLIQDVLKNEKFLFILLERLFFIWISFYLKTITINSNYNQNTDLIKWTSLKEKIMRLNSNNDAFQKSNVITWWDKYCFYGVQNPSHKVERSNPAKLDELCWNFYTMVLHQTVNWSFQVQYMNNLGF